MNKNNFYFCGDDYMEFSNFAMNMKKIILECKDYPRNNDNESFVIGINAPWGTGKTQFSIMLKNYLEGHWKKAGLSEQEYQEALINTGVASVELEDMCVNTIYYDAWRNDFWNNAFEPLFDSLIQSGLLREEAEEKDIQDLLKSATKIIALGIKGVLVKKIEDVVSSDVIEQMLQETKNYCDNALNLDYQTQKIFPEYFAFNQAVIALRNYLRNVVNMKGTLVIFIDELDRCKPTFAVQTLEIVKHLFNVHGLIFIFSLDILQLSHGIKSVYGYDFDATGYLESFFNMVALLPSNYNYRSINLNLELFGMTNFNDKSQNAIPKILKYFMLSMREVKTVFSNYFILNKIKHYDTKSVNFQILRFYFIIVKYKMPSIFSDAVFGMKTDDMCDLLKRYPVPFLEIDEEGYKNFVATVLLNDTLDNIAFSVRKNGEWGYKDVKIFNVSYPYVSFKGGKEYKCSSHSTLSYVLFEEDIKVYDSIKQYTPLEYIYRTIDLF